MESLFRVEVEMQNRTTSDPRRSQYPPQAYQFVREGLDYTVKSLHGDKAGDASGAGRRGEGDEGRHVSGHQLCLGLRDFAIKQYGMLAKAVLASWTVHATADFGRIVFDMVEAHVLRKTDEDTIEDFEGVFDFDEAFGDISVGR